MHWSELALEVWTNNLYMKVTLHAVSFLPCSNISYVRLVTGEAIEVNTLSQEIAPLTQSNARCSKERFNLQSIK